MAETTSTRSSQPDKVDAYMRQLEHPLKEVVEALRQAILAADPTVGEEVKWNAPAFFYTGEMPPFDAKEYRRHLVITELHRPDVIRLVFWGGGKVDDGSGFLTGSYTDGRRLAAFHSIDDVREKRDQLQHVVKEQLRHIDKS